MFLDSHSKCKQKGIRKENFKKTFWLLKLFCVQTEEKKLFEN